MRVDLSRHINIFKDVFDISYFETLVIKHRAEGTLVIAAPQCGLDEYTLCFHPRTINFTLKTHKCSSALACIVSTGASLTICILGDNWAKRGISIKEIFIIERARSSLFGWIELRLGLLGEC